ncbi:hypothetical protein M3Y99_01308600 [Aphelenchoides fujianensis]|nr:hypothetical protein M3Y99_01308600 [Aphelenchoides fujianensis]
MDGPFGRFTMPSCQHALQELVNGTCAGWCDKEAFKNGDIKRASVWYLIKVATPKSMSEYKYFLMFYTFWPVPAEPMMGVVVRGGAFWLGSFASRCAVLLPNREYYRRFLLKRSKTACLLGFQVLAVAVGYGFYLAQYTPEGLLGYFAKNKFKVAELNETRRFAEEGEAITAIHWTDYAIGYLIAVLVLILASELVSALLIFSTLRILAKTTEVHSMATRKLHLQFIRLLSVQVALPFFFIAIPVFVAVLFTVLEISIDRASIFVGYVFLALYSATNTMLSLFFIHPYREHFLRNVLGPFFLPFTLVCSAFRPSQSAPSPTMAADQRTVSATTVL